MQPSEIDSLETEFVKTGASRITEKEIVKVIDKSGEIQKKFYQRGPLSRFVEDGRLFLAFVRDYWAKKYRRVPYGIIAAIVFTLIYVFNPLDLIPDVLPVIGVVDDATVMGACLLLVEQDLLVYKKWLGEVDKSDGKPDS
ncbi:MAG: hypothetical protein A2Y54_10940 [Chloroflexi bacterium RBG_16_51_16]|nr:MAG: hypothetical protein A2Y54_10940 [Chloroflexi bacterium RBG_16_51_16]